MIRYTEKGAGLHERISAAGHWLRCENEEWLASDDEAVQALIDGYTLAEAQEIKRAQISQHAKALRDKVVRAISPGEMASWPIKMAEAAKFAATGDDKLCPMLAAEATVRGVSVADIAARVGGNAGMFARLEAQIGGTDGRHRDAVRALQSFDAVQAYDYSANWPEV